MCNLSIIIPAYNAERYVTRCLKSVFECIDIDNFEIILVDDGSTDHTCELVEQFIHDTKSENIKIVHQQNSRQGAARNHGMRLAQGKYLMFVDVDDYLNPIGFIDLYHLAENNNLDVLHYSINVYNKAGINISCHESKFAEGYIYTGQEVILNNYIIGSVCGAIFNKHFINNLNIRFKEDIFHEDADFMLRLLPEATKIMFSSAPLYSYCWNDGSTDRSKSVESIVKSLKSDVIIARSYIETADSHYGSPIYKYYHKRANSLITSLLFFLITKYKSIDLHQKLQIIEYAKVNGIYPMKGYGTLSIKTTILQIVLNIEFIERVLLKLTTKSEHHINNNV